ncbi:MAG: ChuX/HutX family heme-like substrate-binding protein [Hydrogenophaga sp.]|uniref:ChuX/HutX family heme-like substrate-binding protein n=1 Tax=Hydrogenophaga sp. TaxID=1904254 RepID=UPI00260734AA|nr:ChuX/HutX family heme-like substrate-binding protein [Hydrogenophaga sp.]MDM7941402.1 ChuX/HutX family heme-like substrate-binding protein [Hydrogenophaga sp.]
MTIDTTVENRAAYLLANPDALRSAWSDLLQQHHHLHGPDAAQRLGVPEAALLASRMGHGATELYTDLTELLAPCEAWGKLLLAARNRLGVGLFIMDDARVDVDQTLLRFRTSQHDALVTSQGISRCFLFEEHDAHGHTVSLNWFDAQGDAIGRLFLMSKSGREVAMPWLKAHPLQHASSVWSATVEANAPHLVLPLSGRNETAKQLMAQGKAAASLGQAALLACGHVKEVSVDVRGRGVAARYQGPLRKTSSTPPAVHAVDAACKLHLRMAGVIEALQVQSPDGSIGVRLLEADGGSIDLVPDESPARAGAWLAGLETGVTL